MNEVGDGDFTGEAGDDASQENGGLGDAGAYEVEGGAQDDDVEDVVDQTYRFCISDVMNDGRWGWGWGYRRARMLCILGGRRLRIEP